MSEIMTIFCENDLVEKDVFGLVKSCGGYVMETSVKKQGVIEKDEATVWVYFVADLNFFNTELGFLKDTFNFDTSSIIQMELNSEDETRQLAINICKIFMEKYPNSIFLDDTYSEYYTAAEVQVVGFGLLKK